MGKETLEFIETPKFSKINGRVGLFISKEGNDRDITTTFPITSIFPTERIIGFRIDEQQTPPKLYLDYLFKGQTKNSLDVGIVTDLKEARKYIEKLNIPYKKP